MLFFFQLESISVRHTALALLSIILKRALKTIDYCLNKVAWQDSGVYTPVMMEEFVRIFREALSKVGLETRFDLSRNVLRTHKSGHQVGKAILGTQRRVLSKGSLKLQDWKGWQAGLQG